MQQMFRVAYRGLVDHSVRTGSKDSGMVFTNHILPKHTLTRALTVYSY